jgi:SEC-C motif
LVVKSFTGDDPRRRVQAVNPLSAFARNDPCWCLSGRKYKDCHMIRRLSPPGASTPSDTEDVIYLSPTVSMSRDALTVSGPVAITVQHPTPQAPPLTVDEATAALAAAPSGQPPDHPDIGTLRFALLDMHGITDPEAVRAGHHDRALQKLIADIASGALELARATLDRLLIDGGQSERPVVLYSDQGNIRKVVGQTLLWADHYLTADRLAAAAAAGRDDLASYRGILADVLDLRPLIESGIVIPVFTDLAVAFVDEGIDQMITVDLARPDYVTWAEQQVVLEGPTAREAAFVHVVDDYRHDDMLYFHSAVEWEDASQSADGVLPFRSRLLGRYDPGFDYKPWLATVRRQAVAQLTKSLDVDLAVSNALGADLFTSSPFRARALRRLRGTLSGTSRYDISGAAWADVPWLPGASAGTLMRIASSEPRVEELRRATAAALRTVESGDDVGNTRAVSEAAADLSAAASRLHHDLLRSRSLDLVAPTGIATGSVLVGGTTTPQLILSAILAATATAIPAVRAQLASRKTAAYAFWMARPRKR